MLKTKIKNFGIAQLSLLLSIALGFTLILAMNVHAQSAVVPADAYVGDPDCYWSDGPGTELYVPSGKTCTIDFNVTATNVAGWTDYAAIVYPGGTLEVVGNGSDTKLEINGDIYVMGTLNIGDTSSSNIISLQTINSGNLTLGNSTTASMTVYDNAGAGENRIVMDGTFSVGTQYIFNTPTFSYYNTSTNPNITLGDFEVYGEATLYAGTLRANSVKVSNLGFATPLLDIQSGASLSIEGYYVDGSDKIALGVGYETNAATEVTVGGTLTIPDNPTNDVNVVVGVNTIAPNSRLRVLDGGVVTINEQNTFSVPGDPTSTPSNQAYILANGAGYGLVVEGTFTSDMFVYNHGNITTNKVSGSVLLEAKNHYKQNSGLYVGADTTMNITGEADIDGDATIAGTLNVTECAVVSNDAVETFDASATANILINSSADISCALLGGADEGLRIQGPDTTFTVADGATHLFEVDRTFKVDNGADVDILGEFTIDGSIEVQGDGTTLDINDSTADTSYANEIIVGSGIATPPTPPVFTIRSGGTLYLAEGGIAVEGNLSTSLIHVQGTLSMDPAAVGGGVNIEDYGRMLIDVGGVVNADANGGGGRYFYVGGGTLDVEGTLNLNEIDGMEMWILNGTQTAVVHVYSTGLVDSTASTVITTGLNYDNGFLIIDYGGQMLFDDEVDIDTTNDMQIYGLLEGTDNVYIGCTGTTCKVGPSGEVKVVGGSNPKITVEEYMDLLGKLNGDDGSGDVLVQGSTSARIGSMDNTGSDENSYFYILARDFTIESGASIDVSDFRYCYDPGGTPTFGGSYGGEGQGGNTETFGEAKYITAPVYPGIRNPVGMCGFDDSGSEATKGGGAVYIEANRDITIDGLIRANGENSSDDSTGAGSGGLIVINHTAGLGDVAADFTGSADIIADGGTGEGTTDSYGGGGGRIVINSILFEEPDDDATGSPPPQPHYQYEGGVSAFGGESNTSGLGDEYAAPGTIVYLGDLNNPNGTLIADNDGISPENGKVTNITNEGDYVFDRIEARNGTDITFDAVPGTDPVSCFVENSANSSITTGGSCPNTHDKPDTLYINSTYPGAQGGDEPWWSVPVVVGDLTPEFSFVYRNPHEGAQTGTWAAIEVDDTFDFSSPLWSTADGNNPIDISDVGESGRTEDITYGGTALSPNTTYFVRAAFCDDDLCTNQGLWTHRDMGNYYRFSTGATYMEISNSCSDVISVEVPGIGGPLKNSAGKKYGNGTCTFTITSTDGAWDLYYQKAAPGLILNDGTGTYVWDEIQNLDPIYDCTMDTTGNTPEEEYGFNIANLTGMAGVNIFANSDCRRDTGTYPEACGNGAGEGYYDDPNCIFNVDDYASPATAIILDGNGTTPAGATLDLVIHANIDAATVEETYELDTMMIITDVP